MEDYEKLYKDALAKAREIHRNENEKRSDMEWLFPELAESEDEKIRKALVDALNKNLGNGIEKYGTTLNAALAWLEKQCYTKKDIDDAYLKGICDAKHELEKQGTPAMLSEEEQNRYAKVVLTSCALSFIDYLDAHKYEGKMCVSNGECEDIENAFHNAMWDRLHRYYCKYIEKQGEQKPVDKVEPFDKYEGLTDFERTLADICIGWIGEELGWKQYIKDNADVLLKIAIEMFNSIQDAPFEQKSAAWSDEDEKMYKIAFSCIETLEDISNGKNMHADVKEWLKSLKNRIGG